MLDKVIYLIELVCAFIGLIAALCLCGLFICLIVAFFQDVILGKDKVDDTPYGDTKHHGEDRVFYNSDMGFYQVVKYYNSDGQTSYLSASLPEVDATDIKAIKERLNRLEKSSKDNK